MKKFMAILLAAALMAALTPALAADSLDNFQPAQVYDGRFSDVKEGDWYYGGVKTMYELGLMNGTSDTTFSPDANITFPEIKLLMARFAAIYTGDVNGVPSTGDWTQDGVSYLWAKGMDVWLDPNEDSQLVARCNIVGQLGAIVDLSTLPKKNTVVALPDVDANTPYQSEILSLYKAGVLTGTDEYGAFQPRSYISRGELATILVRVVDASQRKSFTLKELTYVGKGVDGLIDIAFTDMPNLMAGIDTFIEMGGDLEDPVAYSLEGGHIMLGMATSGVAENGEHYNHGRSLGLKKLDGGFEVRGLEWVATSMYTAQRAVLKGAFIDCFGTDAANKILAKIDEMVAINTKGWAPKSGGITQEAQNWCDANEYTTTYFQTEDGVIKFEWGQQCEEFHVYYK